MTIRSLIACSVAAAAVPALGGIMTYTGVNGTYQSARTAFTTDFFDLTGEMIGLETFDGLDSSQPVGDMPGNDGRFAPEYADGSAAPLPIMQVTVAAP